MAKMPQVRAMLAMGVPIETIAKRLRMPLRRVQEYRSREAKPEYYKAYQRNYRREVLGDTPLAEVKAKRRRDADRRCAAIQKLLNRGLNRRQVASRLGISASALYFIMRRHRERLGSASKVA